MLNIALCVESVGAFEESSLCGTNNPSPDHERGRELVLFNIDVVSLLHPPHERGVWRGREPGLVGVDNLRPLVILVLPTKSQSLFNLSLVQERTMPELFVCELLVAPDAVDCGTACPKEVRQVRVGHGPILSCHQIDQVDKNGVVSHRLDMGFPGNGEWLLLLDALFIRLMSSVPRLNRFCILTLI